MKRQRMKLGSASAGLLLLLFISVLVQATPATVHANGLKCHPDETGKLCGVFLRPGVRDEFKSTASVAWSHTLDTLRGTQGGQSQQRQVIDRYQDYAILASMSDSIGDFQFDIWTVANVSDIRIYLPSNFTFAYVSSGYGDATTSDKIYSIWTDITDDYSFISVAALANDDPIAPGSNRIEIGRIPSLTSPIPSFTILPGLHHIRLFQVRAPFTAGLYHFKIYVDGSTIGDGNFPIVIVKSSLQPAYVTGLVLLKGLFPPINASGKVTAIGTTGEGKYAEGVGYFGPKDFDSADSDGSYYRYWLFGLSAGTFELTASASGFLKTSRRVTVDPGQSLRQDFELEKGVQISLTVWSKDQKGLIPWGNLWQPPYGTNNPYLPITDGSYHRDILVRLLDQYEETVGYWASDDIDPPYGPPCNVATVDGKRNYSPLVLKPSTIPSHDSYSMTLTDIRGLPAARLDGHVPANSADFVEGIDTGSYTVEVQVTGYIMREADDWQRTFTLPSNAKNYTLQVDLRRSGWVNASALIRDSQYAPVSNCTYVVVAKSTDNFDKGIAAWIFKAGAQEASIILEGFNAAYSYGGFTGTQSVASTAYQDYGLEPVDYTLEVYMADMGSPWKRINGTGWYLVEEEEIQVLPPLGGGIEVSFHLKACAIEFALRSIQIQVPPQVVPWTFPGAGIRLSIVDELGNIVATLDPSFYCLIQDAGTTNGTIGWPIPGAPALPANSFGVSPHDNDNVNPAGRHGLLLVRFTGIDPGPINALSGLYPTRIEEGKYSIFASTLGYIQRYDYSVNILCGVGNDLQMDLVQGTQIRVELNFQHENVPTNFSGFVRVEVYNSQDQLVGASIYGQAQPNYYTLMGVQSGGGYLNYSRTNDFMQIRGPAEGTDFGLPNATRLEALNTFPSSTGNVGDPLYPANFGFINGQRAATSSYVYSSRVARPIPSGNGTIGALDTWALWPSMIRSDANRLSVPAGAIAAFDVFGFNAYYGGPDSRMDGLWANGWDTTNGVAHADSGIRGSRDALELDGAGTFTVRVWAFDPYGPNGVFDPAGPDGIFGTDDDYTSPDPIDAGLSDFRAYAQTVEVTGLEAPWGGSTIVRVTLEEQPSLIGTVSWIDMYGDQRPLAWAQVIETSPGSHWASSATGSYRLWLSEGSYDFFVTTIGEEQFWEPYNFDVVFSRPGVQVFKDATLTVSGTATPEFTNLTFAAAIPMVALLIMSSKRRNGRSQSKR
jgi:hypothetical protein